MSQEVRVVADQEPAGPWVIQDIPTGDCFCGSWRQFKPEVSRWKTYETETGARKAAGHIRKFNKDPRITDIHVVQFDEAKARLHRLLHHLDEQAETPAAAASLGSVAGPHMADASPEPTPAPAQPAVLQGIPVPERMTPEWVAASLELAAAADELLKAEEAVAAAQAVVDSAKARFAQAREAVQQAACSSL